MIAEALQWIKDYAAVKTFTVGEKTYSTEKLHQLYDQPAQPVQLPVPTHMKVTTLAGFADLIGEQIEDFEAKRYVIHVVDHRIVQLVSRLSDDCGRRQTLIEAKPVDFKLFPFDQWLQQEPFVIAINALFAPTEDKDYVLRIASSITNEAASTSEDDGHSQRLTIKAGLAQKVNEVVKPQVKLAPYRTFPECQQPISEFVFRARPGDQPTFMLTEADGGKWKIAAIDEVARKLATLDIKDLKVIS